MYVCACVRQSSCRRGGACFRTHVKTYRSSLWEEGGRVQCIMAAGSRPRFDFSYTKSTVHVHRDQVLGVGSFGTVCKACVDDFVCAAKTLHPMLTAGGDAVATRFRQECDFLCALKHPNIVQYLGVFEDPASRQPLLLMELMNDENLTQFLDKSPRLLPFHLQVDILHDVAKALAYLHSNNVIHRDLSGSNVLLLGNALKAKVCDFGVSRLLDISPGYRQSLTMCPGNPAYMPPEALRDNPKYDTKLDCFSFGVLVVQVLTRLFPQPGDRNEQIQDSRDGRGGRGTLMWLVPEVDRRQNHISLVSQQNPLLRVALACLKDDPAERPSARHVCEQVSALKTSHLYQTSVNKADAGIPTTPGPPRIPEPRQEPESLPILRERQEQVHTCGDSWKEIASLKEQLRVKGTLVEDILMNAEVREKLIAEARAKAESEKRVSGQLRQQISQNQKDMQQLHQQLAQYQQQCDDLTQQYQMEQQQRYVSQAEIYRLRQEIDQTGDLIDTLQHQLRETKNREWGRQQELASTRDELTKLRREHEEGQLRAAREKGQLSSRVEELARERDDFDVRLCEALSELRQLRETLGRERTSADERMRQKEDRIRELEGRLKEANRSTPERQLTQQVQTLPTGDSWNIPRHEVEIIPNKEIGRGATGFVQEGRYRNQQVAVKQIHQSILSNLPVVNEFKREVKIMAAIKHPNLVRFVGAVFDEDREEMINSPLLIVELLQGDLRKAYQKGEIESKYQRISLFRDVAYGLHYLHSHQVPIVHRDVSTPNVLLESLPGAGGFWRGKLSDFGSANYLKNSVTCGVGAIVYSAPEMFPRENPSTPMPTHTTKCDVFSYGILLAEVTAKKMPTTENRHLIFSEVESKWPLIYHLVCQCTETSPNVRPAMSDVLDMLNRIPIARPRNRSLPSQSGVESGSAN